MGKRSTTSYRAGPAESRLRTSVTSSTGHFGLAASRTLHFGLGASSKVERLRVRWPDAKGTVETIADVPVDRRLLLRQGEGKVRLR